MIPEAATEALKALKPEKPSLVETAIFRGLAPSESQRLDRQCLCKAGASSRNRGKAVGGIPQPWSRFMETGSDYLQQSRSHHRQYMNMLVTIDKVRRETYCPFEGGYLSLDLSDDFVTVKMAGKSHSCQLARRGECIGRGHNAHFPKRRARRQVEMKPYRNLVVHGCKLASEHRPPATIGHRTRCGYPAVRSQLQDAARYSLGKTEIISAENNGVRRQTCLPQKDSVKAIFAFCD